MGTRTVPPVPATVVDRRLDRRRVVGRAVALGALVLDVDDERRGRGRRASGSRFGLGRVRFGRGGKRDEAGRQQEARAKDCHAHCSLGNHRGQLTTLAHASAFAEESRITSRLFSGHQARRERRIAELGEGLNPAIGKLDEIHEFGLRELVRPGMPDRAPPMDRDLMAIDQHR